MAYASKTLLHYWAKKPISRRSLLVAVAVSAFANTALGKAVGASPSIVNMILGRPTNNSIALSILATEKVSAYVEYGYTKSKYSGKSSTVSIDQDNPFVIELTGLKANTKIYYRLRYATSGSSTFQSGKQYSFSTAKAPASTFSFTVHGDTHPERNGKMFNSELYYVTMANVAEIGRAHV